MTKATAICAAAAALALSKGALGAGLYEADPGVRALGRGGALIAGADDGSSIYYNPAGLGYAHRQAYVDASWVRFNGNYQRVARVDQVDPNTGQPTGQAYDQTYPKVQGSTPFIPIPTWAVTYSFGPHKPTVAIGGFSPYAALADYPENGPQRYSLVSLKGSILTTFGAWIAWAPTRNFSIGAGAQVMAGWLKTSVALSACVPDRFSCAPEQPEWDAHAQLTALPIIAPTGNVGVIWAPVHDVRFGASFQLPVWIDAPAKVKVRLPSTAIFDDASQQGEDARLSMRLPWIARAGVEYRGIRDTRIEASFSYEAWSMHDSIDVTPKNISLQNIALFPQQYAVPKINIVRGFRDTWSAHLGIEKTFEVHDTKFELRAGGSYQRSAIPPQYLSVMTMDLDKITPAVGASLYVDLWRLDIVYAHEFGIPTDVDPGAAGIPQQNPISPPGSAPHYVNGGHYSASADIIGLGATLIY
jgi:long-chain fatty acid transport protein